MAAHISTQADGAITMISRWLFNCYVIHDGGHGHAVVVDPGTPSNGRDTLGVVRALHGEGPGAVLATHAHSDHVAGLEQACGEVGFHLPAACEPWLAPGRELAAPGLREVIKIAPVMASQPFDLAVLRELAPLASKVGTQSDGLHVWKAPAGFVADGDTVPATDGWEVLATPGHTADSTCFYHRDTATLLSGDTVLTHEGRAWFNPEHLLAAESSATEERLRSLPVEHLLPGHGLAIHGKDLLGRARSFLERPGAVVVVPDLPAPGQLVSPVRGCGTPRVSR